MAGAGDVVGGLAERDACPWCGGAVSRLRVVAVVVGGLVAAAGVGVMGLQQRAVDGELTVDVEVPVTATDLVSRRSLTSPVLARHPTVPEVVAAAIRTDTPGPDCGLAISGTSGTDWWPVRLFDRLPDGLEACYAPDVGFDQSGRLVFTFVGMSGPPPEPAGLWALASDDHAQTFSAPRKIADVATTATSVAVTDGGMEVVWLDPAGGEADSWAIGSAVLAASGGLDGVGVPQVVADPDGLVAAPVVAVGPDDAVVVAYFQLPERASVDDGADSLVEAGPWHLMVARRPLGSSFEQPLAVAKVAMPPPTDAYPWLIASRGIAVPGLAVGPDGRVCVAWTGVDVQALDAWVACSADSGQTWAEPVQVGGDLPGRTFQWLPQIEFDHAGRLHAVFYHHRADAEDGQAVDAYYTITGDPTGGFEDTVRLSTRSFTPDQAPVPGWFGTRLGLVVAEGSPAVAMWADSRHALPRVYPAQGMMAATIRPPDRAPPAGWIGAALAAAGLVLVAVAARGLFGRRTTDRPGNHTAAGSAAERDRSA